MKICIKDGLVVDPKNNLHDIYDVLIDDNRICDIKKNICLDGVLQIDAKDKLVIPGMIDMHCHLREPGYEYKETIFTGSRAAAVGGYTSIACMANTLPSVDNGAVVSFIKMKAEKEGAVRVYPIGAITKGLQGKELAEIGELKEAGVVALSDDGNPVSNSNLMKLALQYAKDYNLLIVSHCEDMRLVNEGVMNEGYMSTVLGLKGNTRAAEELMIAREIILAETYDAKIHIAHVSTKGGVDLIRYAKEKGVHVTAETAPHYFSATDEWVVEYDTNTRVNPPLRTQEDVEAIKMGLKDGTIDCIATDHAPHHRDDKEVEYNLAASGISGFETAFSLAYTHLVDKGILTMDELVRKMSFNPAEILGISGGHLSIGAKADVTIIDPDKQYVVNKDEFISKGKNTPFHGRSLKGKVWGTVVDGNIIVKDGELQI